jgi:hypothetical protein
MDKRNGMAGYVNAYIGPFYLKKLVCCSQKRSLPLYMEG